MKKQLQKIANCYLQSFASDGKTPSISMLWACLAFICLLQIPASFFLESFSISFAIIFNELLVIAGIPVLIVSWQKIDRNNIFPVHNPGLKMFLLLFALTLSADVIIDYLTSASELLFPLPETHAKSLERIMEAGSAGEFVKKTFLLCLIPGICEEIFFRGFCQTTLSRKHGANKAIIITGLLFALLHGNPWYFHLYFLLGIWFSWLYAISGNLALPITCHVLNNFWTLTNNHLGNTFPQNSFTDKFDLSIIICSLALLYWSIKKIRQQSYESSS